MSRFNRLKPYWLSRAAPKPPPPGRTQFQRILQRFNTTPYLLAQLLGAAPSTVYRWGYPYPKGTGGVIPRTAMGEIARIARVQGVLLDSTDFDHRVLP